MEHGRYYPLLMLKKEIEAYQHSAQAYTLACLHVSNTVIEENLQRIQRISIPLQMDGFINDFRGNADSYGSVRVNVGNFESMLCGIFGRLTDNWRLGQFHERIRAG